MLEALESVPDEEAGIHLFWLAEKLERTPYSVVCKIAATKRMERSLPQDFWRYPPVWLGHQRLCSAERSELTVSRPFPSEHRVFS